MHEQPEKTKEEYNSVCVFIVPTDEKLPKERTAQENYDDLYRDVTPAPSSTVAEVVSHWLSTAAKVHPGAFITTSSQIALVFSLWICRSVWIAVMLFAVSVVGQACEALRAHHGARSRKRKTNPNSHGGA